MKKRSILTKSKVVILNFSYKILSMKYLLPFIIIISGFISASAQTNSAQVAQTVTVVVADSIDLPTKENYGTPVSHFTWGADLGSSIDMTGQDMTSINIDANFGYRGKYVQLAGLGAGIRMMTSNSSRCFPIYAIARSNFADKPSLCFAQLKAGISLNNLYTDIYQRGFYGAVNFGIRLATGKTFSSHLLLSYEFMQVNRASDPEAIRPISDIHYASISIGVNF